MRLVIVQYAGDYAEAFEPTFRTLNCHIRFLTPIFIHFYAGEATELRKHSIPQKGSA